MAARPALSPPAATVARAADNGKRNNFESAFDMFRLSVRLFLWRRPGRHTSRRGCCKLGLQILDHLTGFVGLEQRHKNR